MPNSGFLTKERLSWVNLMVTVVLPSKWSIDLLFMLEKTNWKNVVMSSLYATLCPCFVVFLKCFSTMKNQKKVLLLEFPNV